VALVLDTGPILADLDAGDPYHWPCSELIASTRERRVVPAPVLPEVDHLARTHIGAEAFTAFLRDIRRGSYDVEDLLASDYDRVGEILETYRDLGVGFVDAAVLAIVERLGETKLATLDRRHFAAMRPRHRESLELLPAV
jgi:predicted nucleic acid-binding protein